MAPEVAVLDIAPDCDEGRTSRVRLRVEQLDSKHTKGILLLHAFGSVIALAVAIATVVLLHKKVTLMCTSLRGRTPPLRYACVDLVQRALPLPCRRRPPGWRTAISMM